MSKPKKIPPGTYTAQISDVSVKNGALEIKATVPAMGGKEIVLKRIQKPKRRRR